MQTDTHEGIEKEILLFNSMSVSINPLHHIPILGSSNLANKFVMSKVWTYGDTII